MLNHSFSHFFKTFLTFLNCIQGDHATMHMKKLPMFTYNLWMGCLQPNTKLIILSSYQHCDEHATISNTLMCILHNYSSIKARFSHTSTVIRLHSCSGKNTRTPCMHLVFIWKSIFLSIFKTKYTTKSTSVS